MTEDQASLHEDNNSEPSDSDSDETEAQRRESSETAVSNGSPISRRSSSSVLSRSGTGEDRKESVRRSTYELIERLLAASREDGMSLLPGLPEKVWCMIITVWCCS